MLRRQAEQVLCTNSCSAPGWSAAAGMAHAGITPAKPTCQQSRLADPALSAHPPAAADAPPHPKKHAQCGSLRSSARRQHPADGRIGGGRAGRPARAGGRLRPGAPHGRRGRRALQHVRHRGSPGARGAARGPHLQGARPELANTLVPQMRWSRAPEHPRRLPRCQSLDH